MIVATLGSTPTEKDSVPIPRIEKLNSRASSAAWKFSVGASWGKSCGLAIWAFSSVSSEITATLAGTSCSDSLRLLAVTTISPTVVASSCAGCGVALWASAAPGTMIREQAAISRRDLVDRWFGIQVSPSGKATRNARGGFCRPIFKPALEGYWL